MKNLKLVKRKEDLGPSRGWKSRYESKRMRHVFIRLCTQCEEFSTVQ